MGRIPLWLAAWGAVLALALLVPEFPAMPDQGKGGTMSRFEPDTFEEVVPGSFYDSPCSPEFDELSLDDQGLRINGPEKVHVAFDEEGFVPDTSIPLCLGLKLPAAFFVSHDPFTTQVAVVAVNKRTGASFTANLAPQRPIGKSPRRPVTPEEVEGQVMTKHFNVDLLEYLPLPPEGATYIVYATVEDRKSNTIEIELVPE